MQALTKIAFNEVSALIGPRVTAVIHGDVSLNQGNPLRVCVREWDVAEVEGEPMLVLHLAPALTPQGAA